MNKVIGQKQGKVSFLSGRLLLCIAAGSAPLLCASSAQAKPPVATTEVWPGRRVVFLLPVQLSSNWNIDPQWGQRLLPEAESRLRRALEATGKFSVIQPYRFNPMLQRALQEKRIDQAQLDAAVDTPSLQSASGVLDKLGFALPPLIAEFRLEEVRASGTEKAPSVQVQVLGKLYELNSESAAQTKVFTSDPIRGRGTQAEQIIDATENAFRMVAAEFVRPPAEVELPRIDPPKTPEGETGAKGAATGKPGKKPTTGTTKPATTPATPATPVSPAAPTAPPSTLPPVVVGPAPQSPVNPTFNGGAINPLDRTP